MAEIARTTTQFQVTSVVTSGSSGSTRVWAVDALRGLVMVIMALDHTRDYLTYLRFQPEDLTHSYPALFFTRWITHFCAPLFFFLAGTGALLLRAKSGATGTVARFLWTRGLWLMALEFTVIRVCVDLRALALRRSDLVAWLRDDHSRRVGMAA